MSAEDQQQVRCRIPARGRAQCGKACALWHRRTQGFRCCAREHRCRWHGDMPGEGGMRQVLEGIRVADFSHVMAGPYATHLLRLLGAEVIKIEPPGRGDAMRYYGADRRYDGMAPAFIAVNAGKKSMVLDLKQSRGSGCRAQTRCPLRRAGREFPPRRDGAARSRLCSRPRAQSPHRLLLGVRLRTIGSAPRLAGHRQHRAGHQRHDEPGRRSGRAADARGLSGRRYPDRADCGVRHRGRAAAPGADRRGRLHRRRDVRCDHGLHGLGGRALSRDRSSRWSAPATPATAASPLRRCSSRATAIASRSAWCSSTSSSCWPVCWASCSGWLTHALQTRTSVASIRPRCRTRCRPCLRSVMPRNGNSC